MKETIVTDEIVEKAVSAYLNAEAAGGSSVYPPALRAALTAVIDDLVRGEREECAMLTQMMQPHWTGEGTPEETEEPEDFRNRIAAAIRARG